MRWRGDVECLGGRCLIESSKVSEFNEFRLVGHQAFELLKHFVNTDDFIQINRRVHCNLAKRFVGSISAALNTPTAPSVFNQNSPHRLRRRGEEVPSIVPGLRFSAKQSQVSFMNQSRRLQRVLGRLKSHLSRRKSSQLFINQWQQLLRSARFSGRHPMKDA